MTWFNDYILGKSGPIVNPIIAKVNPTSYYSTHTLNFMFVNLGKTILQDINFCKLKRQKLTYISNIVVKLIWNDTEFGELESSGNLPSLVRRVGAMPYKLMKPESERSISAQKVYL